MLAGSTAAVAASLSESMTLLAGRGASPCRIGPWSPNILGPLATALQDFCVPVEITDTVPSPLLVT